MKTEIENCAKKKFSPIRRRFDEVFEGKTLGTIHGGQYILDPIVELNNPHRFDVKVRILEVIERRELQLSMLFFPAQKLKTRS